MPDVLIRPLQSADIPVIATWIADTALWQRYQFTAEKVRDALEAALLRDDLLLAADLDQADESSPEKACGLAWVMRQAAFGRSPYLRILGVNSHHTGYGLGAILLQHAERAASEFAAELFLLTSDFNLSAQRFYQRQGYSEVGALPGYVLPDVTELIYWKRL